MWRMKGDEQLRAVGVMGRLRKMHSCGGGVCLQIRKECYTTYNNDVGKCYAIKCNNGCRKMLTLNTAKIQEHFTLNVSFRHLLNMFTVMVKLAHLRFIITYSVPLCYIVLQHSTFIHVTTFRGPTYPAQGRWVQVDYIQ